jgi:diphthamide synthase subunit DPH2
MKISICASIQFTNEIKQISDYLKSKGHEVIIPDGAERIISGEISMEQFLINVESGEGANQKIEHDVLREYFKKIGNSDAILVLNYKKKNIENYIGGNTFLEMGFAYVQNKKIFLYNPIPEMHYKDELITMQPIIINGNLDLIK